MSDEEKQASWWTTLPGILTAVAAVITAVTGLVLGLGQLGLFGREPTDATGNGVTTTSAVDPGEVPGDTPTGNGTQDVASGWIVTLPPQYAYRSGDVEYELLEANARPDVGGQLAAEITIRCTNHGPYDINFWDRTFRLDAGGTRIAPDSGLNEICLADASTTGMVRFVFPAEVRDPVLRIMFDEGESAVQLQVAPV